MWAILSPSKLVVPSIFLNVKLDAQRHEELLAEVQRFRGAVYLKDGVANEVDVDRQSWHVLSLDWEYHISACLRFTDGAAPRVGGWAVAESHRSTREAVRIVLATYGLLELLGGRVGVCTATVRHGSAATLKRIGLKASALPYFDWKYGCQMELLRFDSRCPNPKYVGMVKALSIELMDAQVIVQRSTPLDGVASRASEWSGLKAA